MLNLPTNKKEIINQDNLQDGIDDIISTPKEPLLTMMMITTINPL